MRYGVCAGIDAAPAVAAAGYDYIELSVATDLMPDAGEAHWEDRRNSILNMPLPVEAFNSFVRAHRIVGPEANPVALRRYVDTALTRAARVGGHIVVFGSGGARNIPAGYDRSLAASQLDSFLAICADAADRTGIIVAIEPLRRAESNTINLVSEGAMVARHIGRSGVRCLADSYHMEAEDEPLTSIIDSADVIVHVHTADTGRFSPGTGVYDHEALFCALRTAGYDARVSIECSFNPENGEFAAQIARSLAHLRAAAAKAGY